MKRIITLVFSVFVLSAAFAQQNELKTATKLMSNAILNNDFETIYAMTLPQFVDRAGGKTKFIELLKSSQQNFAKADLKLKSVFIGETTTIVKAGNELHAIVPQQSVFMQKGNETIVKNFLLAISKDNGKTWFFFNLEGFDNETIKTYFPDFNQQLKVPITPKPFQTFRP